MKNILIMLILFAVFIPATHASQIARLNLNELPTKSKYIVLGKVVHVSPKDVRDIVTIRVASTLKGKLESDELTFMLTTRGGIKDFDPQLKIGDMGVFFLNEFNGEIKKAYWGSIAIFNKKSNFQFE